MERRLRLSLCHDTSALLLSVSGEGAEATHEGSDQGQTARCPGVTVQTNQHIPADPLPSASCPSHPCPHSCSPLFIKKTCPQPVQLAWVDAFGVSTLTGVCCQGHGRDLKEGSWESKGAFQEPFVSPCRHMLTSSDLRTRPRIVFTLCSFLRLNLLETSLSWNINTTCLGVISVL